MSSSINALNGNDVSLQFEEFARLAGKSSNVVVFFALSQGGLAPQMSLRDHGYEAADHGPITYTLSKDAETGSVNIKYSNPEGSPLKFSWTATVDVDGKVATTPIQIEE